MISWGVFICGAIALLAVTYGIIHVISLAMTVTETEETETEMVIYEEPRYMTMEESFAAIDATNAKMDALFEIFK